MSQNKVHEFKNPISHLNSVFRAEKGTKEERKLLDHCMTQQMTGFFLCLGAGTGGMWLATRRLNKFLRVGLAAGVGYFTGRFGLRESTYQGVELILSQEGSPLQQELANIILKKHQHRHRIMQLMSKHFYPENVIDDSCIDQLKQRWRLRMFSTDGAQYGGTHDINSYDKKTNVKFEPVYVPTNY